MIDYSSSPVPLRECDKLIITTDGLFKLLADSEIQRIVENFSKLDDAVQTLGLKAKAAARLGRVRRDNMTTALVRIS